MSSLGRLRTGREHLGSYPARLTNAEVRKLFQTRPFRRESVCRRLRETRTWDRPPARPVPPAAPVPAGPRPPRAAGGPPRRVRGGVEAVGTGLSAREPRDRGASVRDAAGGTRF